MPFGGGLILIGVGLMLRFGIPDPDALRVYQPVGLVFVGFGVAGLVRECAVAAFARGISVYLSSERGQR